MRVSGVSLGISSREDSVDKDKSANNLSSKAITLGVAMVHNVGSTTIALIKGWSKTLHNPSSTDSSKALHDYVKHCPCKGQLPCQKEPKGHSWVYVSTYCKQYIHIYLISTQTLKKKKKKKGESKNNKKRKFFYLKKKRKLANLRYQQCSKPVQRSYHQRPKQFLGYPQLYTYL